MATSTSISLFRSLLREAKHVNDFNFRMYAIRRAKAGFLANKNLVGEEAASAIQEGQKQLEMLKRQSTLGQMYPSSTNVLE